MEYIKTNNPNYSIDPKTNSIINTNTNELLEYKQKVALYRKVNDLENDIHDIKNALHQILGKLNG